jgi:hypothetical protein
MAELPLQSLRTQHTGVKMKINVIFDIELIFPWGHQFVTGSVLSAG